MRQQGPRQLFGGRGTPILARTAATRRKWRTQVGAAAKMTVGRDRICAAPALRLAFRPPCRTSYDSTPPPSYPPLPSFEGGPGAGGRAAHHRGRRRARRRRQELLTVEPRGVLRAARRDVVVVRRRPFGSNLHAVFGLDSPPLRSPTAIDEGTAELVATTVPGPAHPATAYDPMSRHAAPRRAASAPLARAARGARADYVVLNLGASTTPARSTCSSRPTSASA